jgi:hypothetical protein
MVTEDAIGLAKKHSRIALGLTLTYMFQSTSELFRCCHYKECAD